MLVLIPTHGRPTLLGRTLASLGACRLPAGYGEAVVVENGPKAGAEAVVAEAARAHPALRLRYLHVERANKSHALNEALETVGDGLAVFFDDDVRLDPGVLEAYAEAAEAHPERAYFGGPVGVDYEEEPPAWLIPHLPHSARGYELSDRGSMTDEYLGFNWAAFVSDLREVGGFDPAFGPGSPSGARGQESEMQRRLRASGVLPHDVAGATVWHYVPWHRCSPRWVLGRRYRMGMSRALWDNQGGGYREAGLAVTRATGSLVKRLLVGDRGGAFSALCGLASNAGLLQAHLARRRQ